MNQFKGTGVALVTPFNNEGKVDAPALKKLVRHVTEGGVDYLVVLGTTGESVTLDSEEKSLVINTVKEANSGNLPIVLGMGGNNTQLVLDTIKSSDFEGIDAILSVSPYYNKPTQDGIFEHYQAIADASPVPVILYNVPGRTGSNISSDTTLRLAGHKNVIAIKEASGDLEQCMRIILDKPDDFMVISGDDALTLPMIACGGSGVISVVANGFPEEFSAMVNAALQSDLKTARRNHYKVTEIIDQLFKEGNPAGIKAALSIKGVCGDTLRLPLVNISNATYDKLEQLIGMLN